MPDLTDWLARNIFVKKSDEEMFAELQEKNRLALERQRAEGKTGFFENLELSGMNDSLGTKTYDENLGKRGAFAFLFALPIWVWIGAAIFLFVKFGGIAWARTAFKK